ncbi:MAG: hypothetical protein U0791_07490 [Gemmataceae bacterium]
MNAALVAMLGLGLAQPPAAAAAPTADYHPFNSRNIKFPIQFAPDKVKSVRKVELHVSNDGGQVWQLAAVAPPTQDVFAYTAPTDGRYWFHIVTEDLSGKKDPPDLTKEAPAMKVLFDTKQPVITLVNAKRAGDEVMVEWKIDDQFPKDDATKVHFRPAGATEGWQEVTVPSNSKNGVRFAPGVAGAITVRVSTTDLVGNKAEVVRELEGAVAAASTSFSPAATVPPPMNAIPAGGPIPPPLELVPMLPSTPPTVPPTTPAPPATVPPAAIPSAPMNLVPPAVIPSAPMSTTPPAVVPSAPATVPPAAIPSAPVNTTPPAAAPAPFVPTTPAGEPVSSAMKNGNAPVPTFDPRANVQPVGGATGPVIEPRATVINAMHFDLNYQVEQRGPSGISRVDLWVTRDDGKSWVWWSKHEGRDPALKVNLGTSSNSQPEGLYGFRLVPVSGAGLSDAAPTAGEAPDMRVIVDTTAPVVKIYPAIADPNAIDALVLQWEATDKNFGDDPITLEWCEGPTGPWRPVAMAANSDTLGGIAKRLPNTGKHSWKVPAGLPPRVYLKVTAKDAAGNTTEQVTREPILVDLTKPRAKITGIGNGPFVRP